jgi:hypothetical protein
VLGRRRDHTRDPKCFSFNLRACTVATAWQKPRRRGERVDGLGARVNGAKGPTLPLTQRARVRGCTGTPVGIRAHACACRCHGHGGGRDSDVDTVARTANTQKEQGRKNKRGCVRGDDSGDTCKNLSQLGSMATSPAACAAAQWRTAALSPSARRSGHPHGRGETRAHLGVHGPKCRRW